MRQERCYRFACGPWPVALTTPFALPLPEQPAAHDAMPVCWTLTAGEVAAEDELLVSAVAGGLRAQVCRQAEFVLAADGITGTYAGDITRWQPAQRRDMLLLPALELALLPRGLIGLHAAAVAGDGWLALFLGASGRGKSTAAQLFMRANGGDLLADDRVLLAGDTVYGWPDNRACPLPERMLWCAAEYAPDRPAATLALPPADAVAQVLAATRFAGLRGLAPNELPGAPAALARLMELAGRARTVRARMAGREPQQFAGLRP
ncbi:MAG TPA: hypothetical protein PKM88_00445 [bacterium]|nr:hypothetical protein [bacterium]